MRDYGVVTKAATTSRQPKGAVEGLKKASVQTAVQPSGVAGELLHLQRQYGNRYLQRALALARKREGESEVVHQQPNADDRGREASNATRLLRTKVLNPLDEALQAFVAAVSPGGKGLAGAAQLAEQAPPGKASAESKLRDTLQEALALEKKLRAKHPDYAKQGGFQGYGENRADQYVCTTFAEEVLRRAGYKVTGAVRGQINIAINWEAELGKKEPTKEERLEALAKVVAQGDPRTKGVVTALVSSKQGTEVTADQLRPGDFVQYWSSYTSGHVVQVSEVLSPGVIMAHGSHLSTRGVTTVEVNLKTKKKVYCVRPIGSSAAVATGSPTTTAVGPAESAGTESPAWLGRAVKSNATWGPKLGWLSRVDEIATHFQKLGYVPPLQTPGQEGFASAVRQYQIQNPPLTPDGVLGSGTWRQIQADMCQIKSPTAIPKTAPASGTTPGTGAHTIPLKGLKGLERSMAKIANEYGSFLEQQSTELGIDVADAAGFLQVESAGRGSSAETGKMIIRFENHLFYRLWGQGHREQFDQYFKFDAKKHWLGHNFRADPKGEFEEVHTSQTREWQVLEFARKLDEEAALQSISMGLAQILGSNHKTLGYASPREMFDAMSGSLQTQAGGLFKFIANDRGGAIVKALKAKDYTLAARYYNGEGQKELYGSKLKAASEAYARVVKQNASPSP